MTKAQRDAAFGFDPPPECECPQGAEYLVRAFEEVSETRHYTESGPARIPHAEVEAWSRLTGTRLAPWEVRCIVAMDRGYVEALTQVIIEDRKRKAQGGGR